MKESSIGRIWHLPGSNASSDDVVLGRDAAARFFSCPAVVSEKLDGMSLTVHRGVDGELHGVLRNEWRHALGGAAARMADLWVQLNADKCAPLVDDGVHVYGEWLWHRVSKRYTTLPAPAVFYALRLGDGRLVPRVRGLETLRRAGLPVVDPCFEGVVGDAAHLRALCTTSVFGPARKEGLIVELQAGGGAEWAKWVDARYRRVASTAIDGSTNTVVDEAARPIARSGARSATNTSRKRATR